MATGKNSLRTALLGFSQSSPHLGERTLAPPPSPEQVKMLRDDLQRISRSNESYFRICVGLLLVVFAGACLFVFKSIDDPKRITVAFAATGVSIMGLFAQMVRLWKDKVNSDLLLTLAGTLDAANLKKVVDALLRSSLTKK